jgi:hypothetical protein
MQDFFGGKVKQNSDLRKHLVGTPALSRWATSCLALSFLIAAPSLYAQVTATLSGTVKDTTGGVIPNAKVVLTNEATRDQRNSTSNGAGFFTFPVLNPGTYDVRVDAPGFKPLEQKGIALNAADQKSLPDLDLQVGGGSQTVVVQENTQIIPTETGQRAAVLDSKDIEQLAIEGRNVTELLKVLPGVTQTANGISNGPSFNPTVATAAESAVGNGLNANGEPNRGGTSQLTDGVDVDDPGCDCNSIGTLNPDMTQEVSVQTSNFGADAPRGPVVINSISKSGGSKYHGEGYFYARNDVLNANDWQSNNQGLPKGSAHYYYPGGNIGGPVPFTHNKLRFWGGYEKYLQNTGNANVLTSFIPTPDMMSGNFTDTAANVQFCDGKQLNATNTNGCNDLTGTILPDGTVVGEGSRPAGMIPAEFISPAATSLSSFWPKANANPLTTPGQYNYYQVIPGVHDGWVYRLRVDYNLNQNNSFYVSYQQGYDTALSQGNGAHIYWTPPNSIPYPGGGLYSTEYTKAISGHFTHIFSPTFTNEFIASWGYGNFPVGPSKGSAAYRSTLNYPDYGTVFNTGSKLIPSYSSAGTYTFPDFSQQDIFETPNGTYLVRKELPAFADNVTKVWGTHTAKFGFYAENVGNIQGASESPNGAINSFSGQNPDALTGRKIGSPNNPTANFLMGVASSYSENSKSPVSDMAYQTLDFYANDLWKITPRITFEYGVRFDHLGHWYDRQSNGLAAWEPQDVAADVAAGKLNPGLRWHGIDPSIPKSGQPDRFLYYEPRLGVAYDLFGNGRTTVRGGWGEYRFTDQYNDYTGALTSAQSILGYTNPGGTNVQLSEIGDLTYSQGINGGVNALPANDTTMPLTQSYNMTVSQQGPFNSLFEIAYVGNRSGNLVVGGESVSGSGFGDFTNQNKVPVGAFFRPDPRTGLISPDPQNLSNVTGNQEADYRPLGYAYGTNSVDVNQDVGYSNYNGLQIDWTKRGQRLTYNLNYTWSKTMGTGIQVDPFNIKNNYSPLAVDRPHVINTSYTYNIGTVVHHDRILDGVANGWTISGITTWQAGGDLQALDSPNFGLSTAYASINGQPLSSTVVLPNGVGTAYGDPTLYGTTAAISIQPLLTCDPRANLQSNQKVNFACFTPPPKGVFGPHEYPYLSGAAYFDSDLAFYKTFHVVDGQTVQFRASAFNWLNHPLPQFSSSNQLTPHYNVDYATKAYTVNSSQNSSTLGFLDNKAGAPTQRTLELALKYQF